MPMDRQEKFDIFQCIRNLVIREWSGTPVRKGMGFRQLPTVKSLDQVRVGDLGAISDHSGCDLSIEKRFRDLPCMESKQIKILPPCMDDLLNLGIADEVPKDMKRSARLHGRKVDDSGGGGASNLN